MSLSAADRAFLEKLPTDGTSRHVVGSELQIAYRLHMVGLCFLSTGEWPGMDVRRTFDTAKALSRE